MLLPSIWSTRKAYYIVKVKSHMYWCILRLSGLGVLSFLINEMDNRHPLIKCANSKERLLTILYYFNFCVINVRDIHDFYI